MRKSSPWRNFARLGRKSPGPKYKNRKTKIDGRVYDSALEADLCLYLKRLVEAGVIRNMRPKPNVQLTRAGIRCIPDFTAEDAVTGRQVYFEAKGFETERWLVIRKLWGHYGPGPLYVFKKTRKGLTLFETLQVSEKGKCECDI